MKLLMAFQSQIHYPLIKSFQDHSFPCEHSIGKILEVLVQNLFLSYPFPEKTRVVNRMDFSTRQEISYGIKFWHARHEIVSVLDIGIIIKINLLSRIGKSKNSMEFFTNTQGAMLALLPTLCYHMFAVFFLI